MVADFGQFYCICMGRVFSVYQITKKQNCRKLNIIKYFRNSVFVSVKLSAQN